MGKQQSHRTRLAVKRHQKKAAAKRRRQLVQVERYEEWEHLDGWRTFVDRKGFIYASR